MLNWKSVNSINLKWNSWVMSFLEMTFTLSQPHFQGSVRSPLTFPKMGLGSPSGFLIIQNVIAGVKIPHIEVFFIPLERS